MLCAAIPTHLRGLGPHAWETLPVRNLDFVDAAVASNRTPRHINSKAVLTILRRRQSISRADLARASGLRPSTISLIVDDLIAGGWVLEGKSAETARGRRPTLLTLNSKRCVIALDIHPSQVTLGIVDIAGRVLSQNIVSLPEDPAQAIGAMVAAIRSLIRASRNLRFEGIGICLPGRTDIDARRLIFAPNLHWPPIRLKARIERATGLPVVMDNVANACALSQVWFGDSVSARDFVVVAISEGIGAGVFVNGRIARGERGMAGEFGHIQMEEDGLRCNCGNRGCWETLASNRAALRIYRQLSGRRRSIAFSHLLRLAEDKDVHARKTLLKVGRDLARGIRMIATALAPAEILVVGEITNAWSLIGPAIEQALSTNALTQTVRVRPAFDNSAARLRSAVALVLGDHVSIGPLQEIEAPVHRV